MSVSMSNILRLVSKHNEILVYSIPHTEITITKRYASDLVIVFQFDSIWKEKRSPELTPNGFLKMTPRQS